MNRPASDTDRRCHHKAGASLKSSIGLGGGWPAGRVGPPAGRRSAAEAIVKHLSLSSPGCAWCLRPAARLLCRSLPVRGLLVTSWSGAILPGMARRKNPISVAGGLARQASMTAVERSRAASRAGRAPKSRLTAEARLAIGRRLAEARAAARARRAGLAVADPAN